MQSTIPSDAEWLEADGLGGFASGTAGGLRTRRYHGLLLCATTPPTGRTMLVNGLEAWLETPAGTVALTSQHYAPDVISPEGLWRRAEFRAEPWPSWRMRTEAGLIVAHELLVAPGRSETLLRWRLEAPTPGGSGAPAPEGAEVRLAVRPLFSGRDFHATHRENPNFRFEAEGTGATRLWRPYPGLPTVALFSNGSYQHEPVWYRRFLYREERARGLDAEEDLAAPGVLRFDLTAGEAVLVLRALAPEARRGPWRGAAASYAARTFAAEAARRADVPAPEQRRAEQFIVQRGDGLSVIAGYPWFADWGRDTFIALRGLCLASGRVGEALEILLTWAEALSEGMLPNRFPESGAPAGSEDGPAFNAVDSALWFVIAVHDTLAAAKRRRTRVATAERKRLEAAVLAILAGYSAGTRHGIRLDADGLLAAGAPGVQLTWMDARAGDWIVTPRVGKPVEVQALWLNALRIGGALAPEWTAPYERGLAAFRARFWRPEAGCLYDVVDADHQPGRDDPAFRPNQIFAVGGLPHALLAPEQAARVVAAVEARLLTPVGLRSLAPDEPDYHGRYEGNVTERDGAYHQGTVWPWLLGPFVEAWLRVHAAQPDARAVARQRFVAPLRARLAEAGPGAAPELADGDPPHAWRGCPFQAWTLGELLRLEALLDSASEP